MNINKYIYKLKMKFNSKLLILTLLLIVPYTFAALNGKCSGRNGICVKTTTCSSYGGVSFSGKCPSDSNDVKCCDSISCSADDGRKGSCMFTDQCSGDMVSGKCPGGSNFKCCVKPNPTPSGSSSSNPGSISTKFDGSKLTRQQFISKLSTYCKAHPSQIASEMCNNLGVVYDTSKSANVNPELVIARAMAEGNSPGISKHNYWGMGCTNTGGLAACITYSSLQAGIKGFGNNVSKYKNLAEMMSKYAYIGKYWYNPGSWSVGGCIYFPYIKKYMSSGRQSTVTSICGKSSKCTTSGGDCTPTTSEDQNAYATWQVKEKLGPYMCKVFGTVC